MRRIAVAMLCTMLLAAVGSGPAQAGTITGVTAGSGLQGGGTNGNVTLSASFGGDGSSAQVCHSDHTHLGDEWTIQDADGLQVNVTCTVPGNCSGRALVGDSEEGYGVVGFVHSQSGAGVAGQSSADVLGIGVEGVALSADGTGVHGSAGHGGVGHPSGVLGEVNADAGAGVFGYNAALTGPGYGVRGTLRSPSGFGVAGTNTATTGNAVGVDGESSSRAGFAGFFRNLAGGTGVRVRVDHAGSATKFISASNGAYLTAGGSWTNSSDVHLKDNFAPSDHHDILRKLQTLPIQEWSYKTEGATVRHVGPTAQDFRAAFALGSDDRTITTVDEAGIALAAIQELDRRTAEIAELREQVRRLEAAVLALQAAAKP